MIDDYESETNVNVFYGSIITCLSQSPKLVSYKRLNNSLYSRAIFTFKRGLSRLATILRADADYYDK